MRTPGLKFPTSCREFRQSGTRSAPSQKMWANLAQIIHIELPAKLAGNRKLQNADQLVLNYGYQTILFHFGPTWSEVALLGTSRQVVGKFDAKKKQPGLTWFLCWSFINKDKLSFIFSCNFAPTWHEVDGFNFRTTCPEVPGIQLPPKLGGSYSTFSTPDQLLVNLTISSISDICPTWAEVTAQSR